MKTETNIIENNRTLTQLFGLLYDKFNEYTAFSVCDTVTDMYNFGDITWNEHRDMTNIIDANYSIAVKKFKAIPNASLFWWEQSDKENRLSFIKYLQDNY